MKAITLVLLTIFLGKSCSNETQNDIAKATLTYTATTRGFFQRIDIANQKATISRDRNGKETPEEFAISTTDWNELIDCFKKLDLEQLSTLKDPTQKRFYDGAAIATLEVTYKGKTYKTTEFDHGFPPKEIEKIVTKIVSLAKVKE